MMGQQPRTESLFYYFRSEDQIRKGHPVPRQNLIRSKNS